MYLVYWYRNDLVFRCLEKWPVCPDFFRMIPVKCHHCCGSTKRCADARSQDRSFKPMHKNPDPTHYERKARRRGPGWLGCRDDPRKDRAAIPSRIEWSIDSYDVDRYDEIIVVWWISDMITEKSGDYKLIPSGKHRNNYGKAPCSLGKATISVVIFNSYAINFQRTTALSDSVSWVRLCSWSDEYDYEIKKKHVCWGSPNSHPIGKLSMAWLWCSWYELLGISAQWLWLYTLYTHL